MTKAKTKATAGGIAEGNWGDRRPPRHEDWIRGEGFSETAPSLGFRKPHEDGLSLEQRTTAEEITAAWR